MPIVTVDTRRRLYLPRELGFKAKKAIIVPRGETYVIIPVPEEVTPIDVDATIGELRQRVEAKV